MGSVVLSVCALLGAAAVACSSDDPTCGRGGDLTVAVSDTANNDMPICDAAVTVTAPGGAPQPLTASGPPTGCTFVGKFGQGSYVVTASKNGYRTATINLRIGTDGCHADSPSMTLGLDRTP